MSKWNSKRPESSSDAAFGTQLPGQEAGQGKAPGHGTQLAPAIPVSAHELPRDRDRFNVVTRTYRADSSRMSILLKETQVASADSGNDMEFAGQSIAAGGPGETGPSSGKSTWNLRIRERHVAGQVSGILNEIPEDLQDATGLQSAFAVDPDQPEYEVLGKLGAGNMGIVYSARQTSLNRELAIKTLKPDTPSVDHDQAMFVSEAVVTAHLVHPNIVPVHDLGRTADGKLFYSMKHVTGTEWSASMSQLTQEQNLEILLKVCDAVAFAHSRGVINRDLKPENVLVGEYGEVVVLDWGLAMTTDNFARRDSIALDFRGGAGTPVYMPPELAEETVDNVGIQTDVYLLGAILYEVLEGFPPHLLKETWAMDDPNAQLARIVDAVVRNEIEEDVYNDGELMQIARRALQTHPMDRYQSVAEFQDAIREYQLTGRAEELMQRVEEHPSDNYERYQSAVALYDEALRKWPDNRRAVDGDRRAREAYARLALKKGDVDLGLQILPESRHREFKAVRSQLKRAKRSRAIMRGTWSLATISAVAGAIVALLLYFQADHAKQLAEAEQDKAESAQKATSKALEDLESANGSLAVLRKEEKKLKDEKNQLNILASMAKNDLREAEKARDAAEDKEADALSSLTKVLGELRTARMNTEDARKETAEAEEGKADAEEKKVEAERKAKVAAESLQQAQGQLADAQKDVFQTFEDRLKAYYDIQDYPKYIQLIQDELDRDEPNPFVIKNKEILEKRLKLAKENAGNAMIPLGEDVGRAVVSQDGTTLIFQSGNAELLVYRNIADADSPKPVARLKIPRSAAQLEVSASGTVICAAGRMFRSVWKSDAGSYKQVNLPDTEVQSPRTKKCQVTPNGQHLFLFSDVGKRSQPESVVEVFDLSGAVPQSMVLRPFQFWPADNRPEITDAVFLPDGAGVVTLTSSANLRLLPLSVEDGQVTFQAHVKGMPLDVAYPKIDPTKGLKDETNFLPQEIFVSQDGQRLGVTSRNLVRVFERSSDDFPFEAQNETASLISVHSTNKPVTSVSFSTDNRVLTTQLRYLQLWESKEDGWGLVKIAGLWKDQSLAGHGGEQIRCAGFLANGSRHLISVGDDNTVRIWDTDQYSKYVSALGGESLPLQTQSDSDSEYPTGQYILTGLPADETEPNRPDGAEKAVRIQQARSVYSAEFSRDSERVIVGANDLAAHTFTAQGKRTLTASMLNPRDPFFAPQRNNFVEGHIPEIVTLKFLPPDGKLLLTFDYFGSLSVWDASEGEDGIGYERSRIIPSKPLGVADETELENGEEKDRPYEVEDPSCEIAVSRDGRWLIAGMVRNDGKPEISQSTDTYFVALWDTRQIMETGSVTPVRELKGEFKHQVTAAAISPNSRQAITATRRGAFTLWNLETGEVIAQLEGAHNSDGVSGVFFRSDTEFVSAGLDGTVLHWTINADGLSFRLLDRPSPDFIIRLRPGPDGQSFITSDLNKNRTTDEYRLTLSRWTEADGWKQLPVSIAAKSDDLDRPYRHDISWSDDGSEILYVHERTLLVFNADTLAPIEGFRLPEGHQAVRGALAPNTPNGRRVATFDGRFAHLWDLQSQKDIAEFRSHGPVVRAAFSADRKFVVTGSDSIRVFNSDESSNNHGRPVFRLTRQVIGKRLIEQAVFSPVTADFRIASIDRAGCVKLWNWSPAGPPPSAEVFSSGESEREIPGWMLDEEAEAANRITWSHDARTLAALQTGRLRVWSISGDEITELNVALPEGIELDSVTFNDVSFSSDSSQLVAVGLRLNDEDDLESWGVVCRVENGQVQPVATIEAAGLHNTGDSGLRGITAAVFDDDSKEIITGAAGSRILRWAQPSGIEENVQPILHIGEKRGKAGDTFTAPHQAPITAVSIAPNGRVVTADEEGWIVIWPPQE